jgi:hypothetical protein
MYTVQLEESFDEQLVDDCDELDEPPVEVMDEGMDI